ncbi:MAG: carbohydrate ABC transporter permease [Candidatus Methanomethylicaceae archaeon]
MRGNKLLNIAYYIAVITLLLIILFPIYAMIKQSLVYEKETYERTLFPKNITLENYLSLAREVSQAGAVGAVGFFVFVRNSFIISISVTLITLFVSTFGGYSLARLNFRGRDLCSLIVIISYLMPAVVLMVPLYILIANINLLNTFEGLILALLSRSAPFCTWFMVGYFKAIPKEIEEVAMVDGASRLGALFKIILPLSLPSLVVNMIFAFTLAWNDFIYSYMLIDKTQLLPLSVALYRLIHGEFVPWGTLMAGGIIASLVPVTLFLIIQRYIIAGLTAGAVKG